MLWLVHCMCGHAWVPAPAYYKRLLLYPNAVCTFLFVCLQPSLLSVVAGGTKGVTRTNRSHSDLVDKSDGKSNRCVCVGGENMQ